MQSRPDSEHSLQSPPTLLQDDARHYGRNPYQSQEGTTPAYVPASVTYQGAAQHHNSSMNLPPDTAHYQYSAPMGPANPSSVDHDALNTPLYSAYEQRTSALRDPLYSDVMVPAFGSTNTHDVTANDFSLPTRPAPHILPTMPVAPAPPAPPAPSIIPTPLTSSPLPAVLPDLPQLSTNPFPPSLATPSPPVSGMNPDANHAPNVRKLSQPKSMDAPLQASATASLPKIPSDPSRPGKFARKRIKKTSKQSVQNTTSHRAVQGSEGSRLQLPNGRNSSFRIEGTGTKNSDAPNVSLAKKPSPDAATSKPAAASVGFAKTDLPSAKFTKTDAANVSFAESDAANVIFAKTDPANDSATKYDAPYFVGIEHDTANVIKKTNVSDSLSKKSDTANVTATKSDVASVVAKEFKVTNAEKTVNGAVNGEVPNFDAASAVLRKTKLENKARTKFSSGLERSNNSNIRSFSRWNTGNKSGRSAAPASHPKSVSSDLQSRAGAPPVSSTANLPPLPPHGIGNIAGGPGSPSDILPKLSPVNNPRSLSPRKRGPDTKFSKQSQPGPPKRKRKSSASTKEPLVLSKLTPTSESETSGKLNGGAVLEEASVQKVRKRSASGGTQSNPVWYDVLRKVWPILRRESPEEEFFSVERIFATVETNWTAVRGNKNPPKNHRWKSGILNILQSHGEHRPSSQSPDASQRNSHMSDLYRFSEPKISDTPGPSGSLSANNALPETNEDAATNAVSKNQNTLIADAPVQATVPREFILEATKPVQLSEVDKARLISFVGPPTDNTVKGCKGFRTIRASAGVSEGDWYFEVQILNNTNDGAVRLGWSLRRSDLETPVGFDGNGFAIRDLSGEFVHRSLRTSYGEPFGKNDVIGCRIQLPPLSLKERKAVEISEKRFLEYRFVKLLQGVAPPDSQLDIYSRAKVTFYKNGKCFGVPSFFTDTSSNGATKSTSMSDSASQKSERNDLLKLNGYQKRVEEAKKREMKAGIYYPAVSLYCNGMARVNFGPDFRYGLPEGSRPMWDAVMPTMGGKSGARKSKSNKDGPSKTKGKSKDELSCNDESDSVEEGEGLRDSMDVDGMEGNGTPVEAVQENDIDKPEVEMHRL